MDLKEIIEKYPELSEMTIEKVFQFQAVISPYGIKYEKRINQNLPLDMRQDLSEVFRVPN